VKKYIFALCAFLACLSCAHAGGGHYADDIRVYWPDGRASFYFNCDVVDFSADTIAANCYERRENQCGHNPLPATGHEPTAHVEIFGVTPGETPWYRVDHANGTGACVITATYLVPFPGTGYILQCDGTDMLFGDTFDGSPFGSGAMGTGC
jgi:hypothetical protein